MLFPKKVFVEISRNFGMGAGTSSVKAALQQRLSQPEPLVNFSSALNRPAIY